MRRCTPNSTVGRTITHSFARAQRRCVDTYYRHLAAIALCAVSFHVRSLTHSRPFCCPLHCCTGCLFTCSHDNLLKSWSLSSGRVDSTFIGSERAIYTIHLSPFNTSLLFSGGYDCIVRVWDIKTAQCTLALKGHTDSIFSLLLLPDGRLVSGSSDKSIKIWNLKAKKCEATLTGHLGGVLSMVWVGASGVFVSASIDHTIKVWDVRALKCEMTMIGHTLPVSSLVLLDDGRIVSASHDKTIRIWNWLSLSAQGQRKPRCESIFIAHTAPIQALTLLADNRLVSCSRDLTIKVWNVQAMTQPLLILQGHTKDINSLAVTQDGRLVSVSSDHTIRVWSIDLQTNTGHCDMSFSNIGAEGRGFVVYGVACYRQPPDDSASIKRSASKNSLSYAANGQATAVSPPATPTQQQPTAPSSVPAPLPFNPALPDPIVVLTKSGTRRRPVSTVAAIGGTTVGAPPTVVIPSSALDAQRRLEKQRRAVELSRRAALDTQRLLLEEEVWDEEEQRRFASLPSLKRDAELGEDVSAWVSKYRNAHHLNYSDYVKDGWYDDGGVIPGVNAARVGRERGGGRWEGDVIVYDASNDSALAELIEYAKRLVRQQDTVKGRVQILAQLVSNKLGGLPNDIVQAWERVMKRAHRYRQQRLDALTPTERATVDTRLILPAGALIGEIGLTRHRACLFKYLCDLTVQNPEEWCTPTRGWEVEDALMSPSPGAVDDEKERESGGGGGGGGGGKSGEGGESGSSALQVPRIGRYMDDSGVPTSRADDDEKLTESDDGRPNRLNQTRPRRASTDSDGDAGKDTTLTRRGQSFSPDELAIHCRLIRGQYQYYVPRSRKHKKDSADASGGPLSPTNAAPSPGGGVEGDEGDERGRERVGGYHAWNAVIIDGQHFVVDLIYHPSQLYNESSREAMHYNRGRRGSPKQTGLTNLPIRDVREIEYSELTHFTTMKDGGFGRLERARWRGSDVVIKTPLTTDQYVLRTFHEEARLLNSLSHPNIVQLIGVCSDKKAIILEYINGGDVHQFIKARKHTQSVTLKERLNMLIQTALAMQYLHGCEPPIVHRDLKSLNLLIQNVGDRKIIKSGDSAAHTRSTQAARHISLPVAHRRLVCVLALPIPLCRCCDFGLARNQNKLDGISTQHKDMGTPCFQSPEQWRDDEEERLTEKIDCFPERDTRVLTNRGLLFLDEIEDRQRAGEEVLFGCYDVASRELRYSTGKIVIRKHPPTHLVEFTSSGEAKRWAKKSGPYGEGLLSNRGDEGSARRQQSRHVSLRVTPHHHMFVQTGYSGAPGKNVWWTETNGVQNPPRKERAVDLLPDCTCAQPDCKECRASIRMLACAAAGYAPTSGSAVAATSSGELCAALVTPSVPLSCVDSTRLSTLASDCWAPASSQPPAMASISASRHRVQAALGLTEAQFPAFLELLGFWLSDGSMQHNMQSANGYVVFSQTKKTDLNFLKDMFAKVGLTHSQWTPRKYGPEEKLLVLKPAWFAWFDEEFGAKPTSAFSATDCSFVNSRTSDEDEEDVEEEEEKKKDDKEDEDEEDEDEEDEDEEDEDEEEEEDDEDKEEHEDEDEQDTVKSVKHLPEWVLAELSRDETRLLIEGLHRADGASSQGQKSIFTSGLAFRDQLMQALLHCGYSAFAGLMYRKHAIRGYYDTVTRRPVSLRAYAKLGEKERRRCNAMTARADKWKVSWTAPTSPSGQGGCLPQMLRRCITSQPYNAERDGRTWCVSIDHPDRLIIAQRAHRRPRSRRVTKQSRPIVVGNCYSFGGILIEMLTDRIPWHEEKSKYAIYQHVVVEKRGPPIASGGLAGGFTIPPMLVELIHWCQMFEPANRPSFPDILRILREVDDSLPPD